MNNGQEKKKHTPEKHDLNGTYTRKEAGIEKVCINGVTMSENFLKWYSEIMNLEVHNDDVWVGGYYKTGTTWTLEMVWMIVNNLDYEGAKRLLQERTPNLEDTPMFDLRPLAQKMNVELPAYRADSVKFLKEQKHPIVIKTHLPWNLLPSQIQTGEKTPKIIYVTREPKDVAVSFYHFLTYIVGYRHSFEYMCNRILTGTALFGGVWEHVISFWEQRHRKNLLILRYDEMKTDLRAVINKVADFLGKKISDTQVDRLFDHLSFENMRNNPAVNFSALLELHKKLKLANDNAEGQFMRSGVVGSHKAYMDPDIAEKFDRKSVEMERKSGFKFL
ncbi:luciferin sulfotransferase-like [Cylas formicarius]|uniref:luciferin sulfotransferase-like n=1 Tax=Cylas formicarius TaxID=197179 RepID=UPI0029586C09|nr:luciferin sulfotransferase-like [Cylas formicarius]